MAIAFARVSIHSRSKGHSAVAAISYRAGLKLCDERTGITHDYSNRKDVVFSELLLPVGVNEAFSNRAFLWNEVERVEKRINSQLCKDVVLALPKNIDLSLQIELAKYFAQAHFVEKGIPADIAIHNDDGNPHAHILIPTRRLEKNGFSKYKARDLNPAFAKGKIVENDYWGEQWRHFQNDFFKEKKLDLVVDLNHLIPDCHQGSSEGYLKEENEFRRKLRIELAKNNVENIIQHLYDHHSVFTRRDVEKLLFKTFKNSEHIQDYLALVEKVLAHKNVIALNKDTYTTQQQLTEESQLFANVDVLMERQAHIFTNNPNSLATHYQLNEEQNIALNYITAGPDLSIVVGRPGVGKSYLLKPVKDYFESNHCKVIGAALSGKVAKAMHTETGVDSFTITSLVYRISQGKFKLEKNHILIIDEAGMVDFKNMSFLIKAVNAAKAKLILVGDPDQLKPIFKGEIFRSMAETTNYIELDNIMRQQDTDDREASINFAKGCIDKAIDHYINKGAVTLCETPDAAMNQLIKDWQEDGIKDSILLAYTRIAVAKLNEKARDALKEKNLLGKEEIELEGKEKLLKISLGERLLFRQNDKALGVRNGDLGTVQSIYGKELHVQLDSGEQTKIPKTYQSIDYGYALTVHKSQGMTTAHSKILIDSKYWDKHLAYVASTRHKQSLKMYADKINHPTLDDLKKILKHSVCKKNVIDFKSELTEFENLLKKNKYSTGYYRQQLDKKLMKLRGEVLKDKNQEAFIKKYYPYISKCIQHRNFKVELLIEK